MIDNSQKDKCNLCGNLLDKDLDGQLSCLNCGEVKESGQMNKFKEGELTKESLKVILHDLECLELRKTKDNKYHYDLLRQNLLDIWGVKE